MTDEGNEQLHSLIHLFILRAWASKPRTWLPASYIRDVFTEEPDDSMRVLRQHLALDDEAWNATLRNMEACAREIVAIVKTGNYLQ